MLKRYTIVLTNGGEPLALPHGLTHNVRLKAIERLGAVVVATDLPALSKDEALQTYERVAPRAAEERAR